MYFRSRRCRDFSRQFCGTSIEVSVAVAGSPILTGDASTKSSARTSARRRRRWGARPGQSEIFRLLLDPIWIVANVTRSDARPMR